MNRLGCAILAAGASRRLGHPKLLLPFKGNELVRHLALEVLASQAEEVAVVVGAEDERVAAAVGDLPLARIVNLDWREGIASSMRAAAHWAKRQGLDALIVAPGDQPYFDAAHVNRLAAEHAAGETIVASQYRDIVDIPALFAATTLDILFTLKGDAGAATLLRRRTWTRTIEWPAGGIDIDAHHDLASMILETPALQAV
jgi:molybdenum cofactor cytidylyltransferase